MDLPGRIAAQVRTDELFALRAAAIAADDIDDLDEPDDLDDLGRPDVPVYGERTLGAVLPGVAAALGVQTGLPAAAFPNCRSACVVLLDGLGLELLADAGADAPFLSGLLDGSGLLAGCPTTTATSMGSFGTGLTPGAHGLLGYEVLDPDRGVLLNELKWDAATDPLRWQPHPTVFGTLVAAGVQVTRIGNPEFRDSGLTTAALRGGNFIGAKRLHARADAAVEVLAGYRPALAYVYWGDVDAAGHAHGWRSPEWGRALRHADRELARLARRLPKDTLLVVTADHGMVDVPHRDRVDLAEEPALAHGVRFLGGESRFAQLYCEPGAAPGVMRRMAETFGDRAWVLDRAQAVAAGWFGPVARRNLGRIGDVLVAAAGSFALVDSRTAAPQVLRLIGQHGSLTTAEQRIPLLSMFA